MKPIETKFCPRCTEWKAISKFALISKGLDCYCKECRKKYNSEYKSKNKNYKQKAKVKDSRLHKKYVDELHPWYLKTLFPQEIRHKLTEEDLKLKATIVTLEREYKKLLKSYKDCFYLQKQFKKVLNNRIKSYDRSKEPN